MSETRLENAENREVRIRERAYHLWEADGRPHGREREFWERAEEIVGMEENPTAGGRPNPMMRPESMPGVTDEGDRRATPKPRARARRSRKT